ncbi:Lipoprotein-releasing system ATP-binding protein LolD [Aliarcobacter thereius]|uniref:Lipoprotein-releasing system ATP-binding protein LolD n=2 Tax=Aliarcobacter thereius TaxID=544718 RepID=A0A1C0B8Y8_9BACT|nr:ABC transporter ATP-binding protein [Aliarcobacter thereius]OCL88786.1 Lipoprotein-releasing system ATP-binding protein LolD [Aliarcobacter thereius]OCL94623.1 Lipoprotein-releasing system ATP-binding protein LolD [Aliarcobacter thereius LMG 24486]OCM00069.1 Lipoprotein-releasing system ATP-binding protein LolD [Aliarcobacter thereius]QBF15500.1 ABC transporter, ATP-binding protein, FtsE/LolD family [Aliarcobacter thereius LMG 24486]TLS91726.1 ABC transporter ATP-binding protein [Aliarcobac
MSENLKNSETPASLLLEAKNISHNFDYELFKDINLKVNSKESIAIIGTSGSGKSTFLNILSSLLKPTTGNVVFKSKDIYSLKQNEILNIRREDFGIIFQAHYLFRGFSAEENLEVAKYLSNKEIDYNFLKELDIAHVLNQGVGELSGGQQQRLSIARILLKKPKIIFADEPTGNLDKDTALLVMNALFKYVKEQDAALVLVTHEESLAFMCDRVLKLEEFNLKEIKE